MTTDWLGYGMKGVQAGVQASPIGWILNALQGGQGAEGVAPVPQTTTGGGAGIAPEYEQVAQRWLELVVAQIGLGPVYDLAGKNVVGIIRILSDGSYGVELMDGTIISAGEYAQGEGYTIPELQFNITQYEPAPGAETDMGYPSMEELMAMQEPSEWEKQQWWYEQQAMSPYQQEQLGMQGYYAPYDIAGQAWDDQMAYTQMMMELQRSPVHWPSMWSITRGGPEIEGQPIPLPQPYWAGWEGGMPPAYETQYQQPVWGEVPWATEPEPVPEPTPTPTPVPTPTPEPYQKQIPIEYFPAGTTQRYWGDLPAEQRTSYMNQYGTFYDWKDVTGGTSTVEYAKWLAGKAGVLPGSRP